MCQLVVPEGRTICPACGWTLTNTLDDSLPIGTLLKNGQFRIERKLGQGGFGITYLATDLALARTIAIKELFQSDWKRQGKMVQTPIKLTASEFQEIKDKFLQEGRVLAGFSDPSIVQVYDQFSENNTAYLVMEYLQGESLAERLTREHIISAEELLTLTQQLSQALRLLHDRGHLHRDIKPDNIILEKGGRAVLIDFGSARQFQAGKTTHMTRLVTPGYAPLEQYAASGRVGPPTDLYALGATLYHALSGQMPPSASDLFNGVALPPLPTGTPGGLITGIETAMQIRMQDRPQTVDEFLRMLTSATDAQQSKPRFAGPKPLLDYLKYLGISPDTFLDRLEEGSIQVSELPPEVRAELIRTKWINAQGQLTFRYAWGNQPRQQPPKPAGSPSPAPNPKPSPNPPQAPSRPPNWTPRPPQPTPVPTPSPIPAAFPDTADVMWLWANIQVIHQPITMPLMLPSLPIPTRKISIRTYLMAASYAVTLGGCVFGFGSLNLNAVAVSLFGILVVFIVFGFWKDSESYSQLREQLANLDLKITERINTYTQSGNAMARFEAQMRELEQIKTQLLNPTALLTEREQAARQKYNQQVIEAELRRHRLEPGLVPGVGVQRIKTLNQYGIHTAFDLDRKPLARISGIGEKIIRDLMDWRSSIERSAQTSVKPFSGGQQLHAEVARELWNLRAMLADGPQLLQVATTEGINNYKQAEADIQALLGEREGLLKRLQSEKI